MTNKDFPKLELFLRLWEIPAARLALAVQMDMMSRAYAEELTAGRVRFKIETEGGDVAILQDVEG